MTDWLPTSENRLRHLLDQGLLAERHNLELKRELPPGRTANKELPRTSPSSGPTAAS